MKSTLRAAVALGSCLVAASTFLNPSVREKVGFDVWNLPALNERIEYETRLGKIYDASGEQLKHREFLRNELLQNFREGRLTLSEAVQHNLELAQTNPVALRAMRDWYHGDNEWESAGKQLLAHMRALALATEDLELVRRCELWACELATLCSP